MAAERLIEVGRILSPHGIKGQLKVESFCDPPERLLSFQSVIIDGTEQRISGRMAGAHALIMLEGVADRDAALRFRGKTVSVARSQLPALDGEYYWADLEGLSVVNREGVVLGIVDHVFSNGSHPILVVRGERECMVPFAIGRHVDRVDLDAGRIDVDWDAL